MGYGGRRIRSTDDGATWTDDQSLVPNGGDDDTLLRTIAWGNGLFVAAGWRIMTSTDGVMWSDTPKDQFNQNWMGQMLWGNARFVGVGGYGSRVESADAKTWTQHSIDTIASHAHGAIAFGAGKGFVSINDDGAVTTSPDGLAWTATATKVGTQAHTAAFGHGVFVIASDQGAITSSDGATWSSPVALASNDVRALVFAHGHFTALAKGHAMTSDDGATWVDHAVMGFDPSAAAYGHATFVALEGNRARTSSDGLTWSAAQDLGGMNALEWIAFGPTK